MNLFDAFAVVLVIVAVLLGVRSGALPQIGGLVGAVAGGGLAVLVVPLLEEPLGDVDPEIRPFLVLIGLLGAVIAGESLGSGLGHWLGSGLRRSVFSGVDRLAGGFVGGAQALLVLWLAGGLLAVGPMPRLAGWAQTSTVVRALNATLPPPTEFAHELGRLLDASGLPDVFIGFEPLPAPPVDRPNDPEARAIAAAAEASTVRVVAATCGLQSSGTGFVVAPQYVVTNAHVIAGGRTLRIAGAAGTHDAEAVLFDPSFDIALLHVPGLDAPVLGLATRDPDRGTAAAVLGYPGGGPLRIVAAAVAGTHPARGRDIYGTERVDRQVLEIHAEIDQGNSGGPLVLPDGSVGGVVFAEARTDDDVGYALTPTRVADLVEPAIGLTSAVGTGACLRP
ncbi:MAG TPA: MarP family serine protease [Clostridia bacterium]|nr:MarP family serine protease [Clostridia bacterium]